MSKGIAHSNEVTVIINRGAVLLLFLDLSIWLGAAVYFSFFAANELFAGFPEDTAAKAVGLLFPTFFTLCSILAFLALLFYFMVSRSSPRTRKGRLVTVGWVLLIVSAVATWANRLFLLPMVQSIESKMGPISRASKHMTDQFFMYHGISMLLDLITIIMVALLWGCIAFGMRFEWK